MKVPSFVKYLRTEGLEVKSVFTTEYECWCGEIKSSLAPGCPKSPHAPTLIKSCGSGDQEEDAVVL